MKKIVLLILCLIILTSCGNQNASPDVSPQKPSTPAVTQTDSPPAEEKPTEPKQEEKKVPVQPESPVPETEIPEKTKDPTLQKEPSAPQTEPSISPEETPSPTSEQTQEPVAETVSITVLGLDGVVVYSAESPHRENLTVLDLLLETAKEKNIPAVYSGGKSAAYVTSIGGYSEKQHGSSSGWTYRVNGEMVMRPCSKCVLNPGDKVEWKYITEFTLD